MAALTGGLTLDAAKPAAIRALVATRVDPTLFEWSYDHVGDLAETVALIWPERPGANRPPDLVEVIERLATAGRAEVPALHGGARAAGIEGLMLKRKDSPYVAGRPKRPWFKWKRCALTANLVLMYAQRGHGKRSSFYSDYTFGAWRAGSDGAVQLAPVGKAHFGFTDEELRQLDKWIRGDTVERFGPVREVRPALVLDVAFDSVHRSNRHKSGLAMQFPRIHCIRWDKPAAADRVDSQTLLVADRRDDPGRHFE